MDVDGQRVLILGLAREGASLARFLASHGAEVTVTDAAPMERLAETVSSIDQSQVQVVVGGDHPELVADTDRVFVSPGVPESNPVYVAALSRDMSVESMTTLFFELCPSPIIGVTGSSGKTTTTSLIGQILKSAGRDVVVGGNIGDPMLDLLPTIGPETMVVLELSSFQLSILRRSPHIAVVTQIAPNHLDRHGTMDAYVAAKLHIVKHQAADDIAVLNATDLYSALFADATAAGKRWFGIDAAAEPLATTRAGWIGLAHAGTWAGILPASEIPLRGRHNVDNVLAAVSAAAECEVEPDKMAEAIRSFRPPPHRLQTVGEHRGVCYVDDSIATSPDRAGVALKAISAPIVLIAGGRDKKLPWEDFAQLVVQRARAVILIGEAAEDIRGAILAALARVNGMLSAGAIYRSSTLEKAVLRASTVARPGDVVLLAPACTSYDMFTDFAERGAAFARAVECLDAA